MTKLEKAREKIDSLIDISKDYSEDTWKDSKEALITLKEALEKQIPKKPKECPLADGRCPSCNAVFDYDWKPKSKYCDSCGQALDWGDSE